MAESMNSRPKIVFSKTLARALWNNTRLVKGDLAAEIRKLKKEDGKGWRFWEAAVLFRNWPRNG